MIASCGIWECLKLFNQLGVLTVGATQVRWNRANSYLLATAHEGDVRLWDTRKGVPFQYIAAHLQKIHGLDWSINQDNQLATSSQDCTVKFFDVENPRVVENALRTVCPVWRARYTPFGDGMTTTQLRRGENNLLLWSLADLSNPVHSFVGHTDVVLEFDWRRCRNGKERVWVWSFRPTLNPSYALCNRGWLPTGYVVEGSKYKDMAGRRKPSKGNVRFLWSYVKA